jgi:hypothetical protein
MLDPVLIALLVEALKRLAEIYLPTLPITVELINAIILLLLGLQVRNLVVAGIARFAPKARGYFLETK